jgi:membrane associated rhomboid family serine protease
MIPIRTDSRLRSTPWMNWGLIAVNVLVFLVQQRVPAMAGKLDLNPRDPHLLNFFTYSLLHANGAHIASNMLFLYIFGNNVCDKMGAFGYLGFYLAAGVFSGVVYVAGGEMNPVIGASGAVSGVTGAYLILFPYARVTIVYFFFYMGVFELPSLWVIGFYFVQDLFMNFTGLSGGVAHTAHLGGSVFGAVLCFGLLSVHLLPRDHFDVYGLFRQWNRRRQFRDLTAKGYDPFKYTSPAIDAGRRLAAPTSPVQDKVQDLKAKITELLAVHDPAGAAERFLEMKKLDPEQVLSRQAQLDVANQLASQQKYTDAADAYEAFLRHYKNFEQVEQVELMLGLVYARYLDRPAKAKEYLLRAMARLHSDAQLKLAREELQKAEIAMALKTSL